jgi:uncharacterized protein (DUF1800 family)
VSAIVALHRFGLGARPGEAAKIADPRSWLDHQVRAGAEAVPPGPTSATLLAEFRTARAAGEGARKAFLARGRTLLVEEVAARFGRAATTDRPFAERMARFWANHLTVSAEKRQVAPFWGAFEREVVRAHLTGRFEDMLIASTRHPAMLLYLDQARSVGPDSMAGQRRDGGLNENLAREILELHTLGVNGGYSQDDVIGLANLLTGWTLGIADGQSFLYAPRAHQPGAHRLLGRSWPEGEEGGLQALRTLARHPATARHLAGKLVRHLMGDEPPARAIAHVEERWRKTEGNLVQVHTALIDLDEAWKRPFTRLRAPDDYVLATARAFAETDGAALSARAEKLGMPQGRAPSPAGWPDTDDAWLGPESMLARIDLANALSIRHREAHAPSLAADLFGPSLSRDTAAMLANAEPRRAIALLAASPEFQRR